MSASKFPTFDRYVIFCGVPGTRGQYLEVGFHPQTCKTHYDLWAAPHKATLFEPNADGHKQASIEALKYCDTCEISYENVVVQAMRTCLADSFDDMNGAK